VELSGFMNACAIGIFVKGRKSIIGIITVMILLGPSDPAATFLEK
jgi:hypothetical protein